MARPTRAKSPACLPGLLAVLDNLLSLFVVFPFTCMYFRGAWDLIGHYILPGTPPLQYWVYVGIGHLQVVGLLVVPCLEARLDRSKRASFWVLSRLFMYAHAVPYIIYWHGLWMLLDHYLGTAWIESAVTLVVTWSTLCLLGSCRSTIWPPFVIAVDTERDALKQVTRFNCKPTSLKDYIADVYISQIVIVGMSICCWRSIFNVMNHVVCPGNAGQSDRLSAYVGLAGCSVLLALQCPLGAVSARLCRARRPGLRLLYEDVVYAGVFVSLTLLWRGVWNLNVRYFLPGGLLGPWVNLALGSVGLLGMQTFTIICNFGVPTDGEDAAGDAFFPVHYLRIYFKGVYSTSHNDALPPDCEEAEKPMTSDDTAEQSI